MYISDPIKKERTTIEKGANIDKRSKDKNKSQYLTLCKYIKLKKSIFVLNWINNV